MTKKMLKKTLFIACSIFLTLSVVCAEASASFSLSFLAKRGEKVWQIFPGDEHDTVLPGDKFHISLQSAKPLNFYLIHSDDKGTVTVLHPGKSSQKVDQNGLYLIDFPSADAWFALDAEGSLERFFVVAADKGVPDLDKAIRQQNKDGKDNKKQDSFEILEVIRRIVQKTSPLASSAVAVETRMAGAYRSPAQEKSSDGFLYTVSLPYVLDITLKK